MTYTDFWEFNPSTAFLGVVRGFFLIEAKLRFANTSENTT